MDAIEEALIEVGLEPRVEVVRIDSDAEAEKHHFFGSPTVRIDSEDIEAKAATVTHFGIATCRPYFFDGKTYDYPPKELISKALRQREYIQPRS